MQDDIFDIRIETADPDVIAIEAVVSLPLVYAPQTAYFFGGQYYIDGAVAELELSDATYTAILAKGADGAASRAYALRARRLAGRLLIVRNTNGADSTEYIRLKDLYEYYLQASQDAKPVKTGAYGQSKQPTIGEISWYV